MQVAVRAAVIVAMLGGIAHAQPEGGDALPYRVRKGDTLELVAAEWYGDRAAAVVLEAANKIQHPRPLAPGERLRIPRDREVITRPGDTLASLAKDYLGDDRRSWLLADVDHLPDTADPLTAGIAVDIPATIVYEGTTGTESLTQIAQTFLGDAKYADLLRRFNGIDHDLLDKGEKVAVPIAQLKIRGAKAPPLDDDAVKRADRHRAMTEAATVALQRARDAWEAGEFGKVVELLAPDAIDVDYLDVALAVDVGVLLGEAYAGQGLDAQAMAAFDKVIHRKPDHALRAFDDSPKVRELWKKAGGKVDE